ncbi:MAG: EF-hand domain-containing protein [Pseudomonadota bacterium]|nr:EF-hand domain-containing protein [Pseudomonadota bacterium]
MNAARKTTLALGALAGSLALSGGAFAMQPLNAGYMNQDPPKQAEGKCGFAQMDTNKDGKISREEFAAAHGGKDDKFAAHDLDGDGHISEAEMAEHHAKKKAASEDKCGEGKCGSGKTEEKKAGEGKCGAGKCGAGKCGGSL